MIKLGTNVLTWSIIFAWFLVIETGRVMLHPEPHMEPKRVIEFTSSGNDIDGGQSACFAARDELIKRGFKAECEESY